MLLVEPARDRHRVLAADRRDGADAVLGDGRLDPLDALGLTVGIEARGREDRAAEREDPRHGPHVQRLVAPLGEALVPAPDPGHLVAAVEAATRYRADDGVEPRAV